MGIGGAGGIDLDDLLPTFDHDPEDGSLESILRLGVALSLHSSSSSLDLRSPAPKDNAL